MNITNLSPERIKFLKWIINNIYDLKKPNIYTDGKEIEEVIIKGFSDVLSTGKYSDGDKETLNDYGKFYKKEYKQYLRSKKNRLERLKNTSDDNKVKAFEVIHETQQSDFSNDYKIAYIDNFFCFDNVIVGYNFKQIIKLIEFIETEL